MTDPEDKLSSHYGFREVSPEEKGRLVKAHFDRIASYYDRMNTLLSLGIHYHWKRDAVRRLGLKPGDRVLDLCGGTGDLSVLAARAVGPRGAVVLGDINRRMMLAGREKLARAGGGGAISLLQTDAERIACASGTFDAAMVGFGIRNVTRWRQGFQEMVRVLKPGGKFLCLEFSDPTAPWFRALYDLYSFRIMPWLGRLCAGNSEGYEYLVESIRLFPKPPDLATLLGDMGLEGVEFRRYTNGIAVAHTGRKTGGRQ
ncbi:MAG: class I SAM-dependent methyltransferase [Deltaproteobacteria bacterium]|nr:class I SAM-dependent methyltransferase [Deltaproteobacteria bacterium]